MDYIDLFASTFYSFPEAFAWVRRRSLSLLFSPCSCFFAFFLPLFNSFQAWSKAAIKQSISRLNHDSLNRVVSAILSAMFLRKHNNQIIQQQQQPEMPRCWSDGYKIELSNNFLPRNSCLSTRQHVCFSLLLLYTRTTTTALSLARPHSLATRPFVSIGHWV